VPARRRRLARRLTAAGPQRAPTPARSREITREISRDQLSASGCGDEGESNGNGRIEFSIKYDDDDDDSSMEKADTGTCGSRT